MIEISSTEYTEAIENYCRKLKSTLGTVERVLLIQIPQFNIATVNRQVVLNRGYYVFPPTGLQFLYEAIKHKGIDIEILDANYQLIRRLHHDVNFEIETWPQIVEEKIEEFKPDIVGISCMYDVGIQCMIQLLKMMKSKGDAILVTGGVIPSFEWKWLLKNDLCHFVIRGDGEDKMSLLIDMLSGENEHSVQPEGICFSFAGKLYGSDDRPAHATLKGTLNASYAQIEIEQYHIFGSLNPFSRIAGMDNAPFAPLQFGRGCRGQCTFCAVRGIMGNGVRPRAVDDIVNEMDYLINKRGVRHFEWLDDDLLFHGRMFKSLLKRIIQNGWRISWSAGNGLVANSIDAEMLELFKKTGCIGFRIGIESGNDDMLKKVKKPGTKNGFRQFAKLIKGYPEIFVGGNFIIGLPGETFGQMIDSFRFAIELELDWSPFSVCQPVRGASAFSDFGDYFLDQLESEGQNMHNLVPTRDNDSGRIDNRDGTKRNLDVFHIDRNEIPLSEQVNEIWFTFNLIVNYIHNRNLISEKRVRKFIQWVDMAQRAHPLSGYMSLFLALAHTMAENRSKAEHFRVIVEELRQEPYWQDRFEAFFLHKIIDDFPKTAKDVISVIHFLRKSCKERYINC